jgi:hypothetical protein
MMRKRAELPSENERSSLIENDESTYQIKEEMKEAHRFGVGRVKGEILLYFSFCTCCKEYH